MIIFVRPASFTVIESTGLNFVSVIVGKLLYTVR